LIDGSPAPGTSAAVLPPGAPGKRGGLWIEVGPHAGRSRVLAVRQRVPLHVGRALYAVPSWPELAHLMVAMPTGGFVQGDHVAMDVVARAGARAHLTSQSATRSYRCPDQAVTQSIRLVAEGDALLEWWPEPLIPFADTDLTQTIDLVADAEATLLVADPWLAGRVARGEVHRYRRLVSTITARRPDGALLFRDTLRVEPPLLAATRGMLGDARALATLVLVGPRVAPELERPLVELLHELAPTSAAVSRLPNECGLVVRVLADRSDLVRQLQRAVLTLARATLYGRGIWALDKT